MEWWYSYEKCIRLMIESIPETPSKQGQKKIYDWFTNIFIFIPDKEWSSYLTKLVYKYPLQQYIISKTKMFEWSFLLVNEVRKAMTLKEYSWNTWRDLTIYKKDRVNLKQYSLGFLFGFLISYLVINKIKY